MSVFYSVIIKNPCVLHGRSVKLGAVLKIPYNIFYESQYLLVYRHDMIQIHCLKFRWYNYWNLLLFLPTVYDLCKPSNQLLRQKKKKKIVIWIFKFMYFFSSAHQICCVLHEMFYFLLFFSLPMENYYQKNKGCKMYFCSFFQF